MTGEESLKTKGLAMSSVAEATTDMLTAYHELNGDIHIVFEEPSPLAFMRYVAKNRPLIVRQGCSKWRAVCKWDAAYLQEVMKDAPVKVAVTPHGLVPQALQTNRWTLKVAKVMPTPP